MSNFDINPLKLREIILNTREPIVLKQFNLNWSCLQDGLAGWCKTFDVSNSSGAIFERISKRDSWEPQWERKRQKILMTGEQFLKEHNKDCDYWSALNYKRIHELPGNCTNGIDFSAFGFPQAADDATLWLSSSGANTPCHYDSYGCNIVVQAFGKKSWLLFPPNTPLTTTRIPYEESSIYCKENLYSPFLDVNAFVEKYKGLAHHVILEPNDVLIVPKHWWHYVEALDISLSVNAWIPLECDLEQQIEECIVKYLIENFIKDCSPTTRKYVMNPNQLMTGSSSNELFKILKYLLEKSSENNLTAKKETTLYDYHYISKSNVDQLLKECTNCINVSSITSKELENLLKTNSLRYSADAEMNSKECSLGFLEEILINSICSPHIVEAIKKEFFKRYKQENL
ncbi:HSPB1-associated protein 1 [Calliphora vicina]|uniref:HSPB1-associated protein 1 n=1 Tax=Calliphora vicina TaxID=7373 RepID=UPI00325B7868